MTLEWKYSSDGVDWEELSALYRAAPLGDKKPAHLQKVFSNSLFKCFVLRELQLVAAGRALADGGDCSYICDIAVLPSHQGTGLGKQLVGHLVEQSRGHKKIILYAVPGARTLLPEVRLPAHEDRDGHLRESAAAVGTRVSQ